MPRNKDLIADSGELCLPVMAVKSEQLSYQAHKIELSSKLYHQTASRALSDGSSPIVEKIHLCYFVFIILTNEIILFGDKITQKPYKNLSSKQIKCATCQVFFVLSWRC